MISPSALLNPRLTHVNVARGSELTSQEYLHGCVSMEEEKMFNPVNKSLVKGSLSVQ